MNRFPLSVFDLKLVRRLLLTGGIFGAALSANAQSIQAGLWKARSALELNGLPLPASEETECISESRAKNARTGIEQALRKKGCGLTHWKVRKKNLEASVKCSGEDLQAEGHLRGSFTAQSYDLRGEAKGSYKSIPSVASIRLTGQRVSACPR